MLTQSHSCKSATFEKFTLALQSCLKSDDILCGYNRRNCLKKWIEVSTRSERKIEFGNRQVESSFDVRRRSLCLSLLMRLRLDRSDGSTVYRNLMFIPSRVSWVSYKDRKRMSRKKNVRSRACGSVTSWYARRNVKRSSWTPYYMQSMIKSHEVTFNASTIWHFCLCDRRTFLLQIPVSLWIRP